MYSIVQNQPGECEVALFAAQFKVWTPYYGLQNLAICNVNSAHAVRKYVQKWIESYAENGDIRFCCSGDTQIDL